MPVLTTEPTWDRHLAGSRERVAFDLGPATDRPRYYEAARGTGTIWAQSTTIPRMQRIFARSLHWVCFTICALTFVLMTIWASAGDDLRGLVTAGVFLLTVVGFVVVSSKTEDYRAGAQLPIERGPERYRWRMRHDALESLRHAVSTSTLASDLLAGLQVMTNGTEELVREYEELNCALVRHQYASTYFIDEAAAFARLDAVEVKLNEITAVHMAAAALVSTLTRPATVTAGAPVETLVPTHLTGQTQHALDQALAVMATLMEQARA